MLDPECADITARILELLGYEGWDRNHPQIVRGVEYLREEQESDGSWYGRWGVNYIYGTWSVLAGLGVNIEAFSTGTENSAWSGEQLFRAKAQITIPEGTSADAVRDALEAISGEIMVDFTISPAG